MGYTHYFSGPARITDAVVGDVKALIEASGVKIAGGLGTGKPTLKRGELRFNGEGDDAYETFLVGPDEPWTFCKTARMPYDVVVAATLLRLHEEDSDFKVSSDGDWDTDDEWVPARELYARVLQREPVRPDGL